MKYKAVIFDLNGTLIHTALEHRYKLLRGIFKEFNNIQPPQTINSLYELRKLPRIQN